MKIWGVMPEGLLERSFAEQRFNAGRGYDSDSNCEAVFALGMLPNIKQRMYAKSRDKRFRTRAAEIFEPSTHKRRGMIGGGSLGRGDRTPPVVPWVPEESKPEEIRTVQCNRLEPGGSQQDGVYQGIAT